MHATGYLDLARELVARVKSGAVLAGSRGEAECRSAISRAYYSAFHVTKALYDALGIELPDSGKCHTAAQDGLNNSGDADLIAVSAELSTLYGERRRADYKLSDPRAEKLSRAETMTLLSAKVIALLSQRTVEYEQNRVMKTAVANAILHWARTSAQPLFAKRSR